MFQDSKIDSVNFESEEKVKTSLQDSDSQTKEISKEEKSEQTIEKLDVEVQTESTDSSNANVEIDYDKLASFLNRIYPKLSKELDKSANSRAFENYEPKWNEFEGDEPIKIHSLVKNEHEIYQNTKYNELKVAGLSWSATGSVLAVGFSYQEHEAWCTHETQIKFFNINSQDVKNSGKSIEVNSCVTCLSYHPKDSRIFAAGTYNGDVLVYNQQKHDSLFGTSSKLSHSHQEKVSYIRWIKNYDTSSSTPYLLVTTGIDGRIMIWYINLEANAFSLQAGFAISFEHTKMYKMAKTPADGTNSELGVSCFDFSSYDPTSFIVGVDGGGILVCSTITTKPALVKSEIALLDPVLYKLERHEGVVTSLTFFPNQPFMLLSSGTDKEIRIYNMKHPQPIKVFYFDWPVFGVDWYPSKLDHFIAWGNNTNVILYNCKLNQEIKKYNFKRDNEERINSVVFNKHSPSLLALGDINGQVDIWKIPLSKNENF